MSSRRPSRAIELLSLGSLSSASRDPSAFSVASIHLQTSEQAGRRQQTRMSAFERIAAGFAAPFVRFGSKPGVRGARCLRQQHPRKQTVPVRCSEWA